jgi:glycosyltransferase involved in cell wall biosynthesis
MKPKFSIVMPNYNKAWCINDALRSVKNQTMPEWDLIVIDDSDDDSMNILNRYDQDDCRVKIFHNDTKRGLDEALIQGIGYVGTDYFGILESDDDLSHRAVDVMFKAHVDNPDCGFIYSQFMFCDKRLKPQCKGFNRSVKPGENMLENGWCASHFKTFKLKDYNKSGGFKNNCPAAQDVYIGYLMEEHTKLLFVDEVLYFYRHYRESAYYQYGGGKVFQKVVDGIKDEAIKRRLKNNL